MLLGRGYLASRNNIATNNQSGMSGSSGPSKLADEKTIKQGLDEFSLEMIAQRTMYNRRTGQNDCHMVAKCKVGEACCAQWELQLYTDHCAGNRKYLKILLSLLSCDKEKIHVDFSLNMVDCFSEDYSADFYVGSCFGTSVADNLTVDNVVRILVLADTHSADNLKIAAQEFIRKHKADVMNTKEWKDMFISHPLLAFETVKCSVWNE